MLLIMINAKLLTEFDIHHRLENCVLNQVLNVLPIAHLMVFAD